MKTLEQMRNEIYRAKNLFNELKENQGNFGYEELRSLTDDLAAEIIKADNRLLSMDKKWVNYGTFASIAHANKYHFGEELAQIIEEVLTGRITHDEDHEFRVEDYEEEISERLFEKLY
jgi:hypothetical protein|nr:MAG TPA: hypothetical protein [Caudoviricetes sp.]